VRKQKGEFPLVQGYTPPPGFGKKEEIKDLKKGKQTHGRGERDEVRKKPALEKTEKTTKADQSGPIYGENNEPGF